MKHLKVLIISHNCFSDSGSNGRTLANFLKGYPSEKLAQFYIYNELPQTSVCENYYRITDVDAVKSFFQRNSGCKLGCTCTEKQSIMEQTSIQKPKKTPFVYLVREFVWGLGFWKSKQLKAWIDEFAPELVLFQAGDAAFLFDFARKVAKKRNIPLVIYNSECYYFKEKNFLAESRFSDFWYKILHRYFRKHARKAICQAKKSVYISDMLRQLYDDEFGMPSTTVMTSTSLLESPPVEKTENITISYLGNLGVGRNETLIELAGILQSIDPALQIAVYGKATPEIEQQFNDTPGISYGGFVSYESCVKIMKESTLLVHIENFSDFYLEDSKYAFSTKIADCLASGTCLFVYAPAELAFTQYLIAEDSACVASNPAEARMCLEQLLRSDVLREKYERSAMETARKNHATENNRTKFLEALC